VSATLRPFLHCVNTPGRMTKQMTAAVGYIRVSTDDQALSVDAQRARLMTWCAERRVTLVRHERVRGLLHLRSPPEALSRRHSPGEAPRK